MSKTPSKAHKEHAKLAFLVDDLCARFVLNTPPEERRSFPRLCFQMELAHWFYEDVYREHDPSLPKLNIREFVTMLFRKCRLLKPYAQRVDAILLEWVQYKVKVPVYGVILLNPTLDKVLVVKGFSKGASWGFPKGKINKNEAPIECAAREAWEETGLDLAGRLKESEVLEATFNQQKVRLYIVRGIPENGDYRPQTKGEISKIKWVPLKALPHSYAVAKSTGDANSYYTIIPFVNPLRSYIKRIKANPKHKKTQIVAQTAPRDRTPASDEKLHSFSPLQRSLYESEEGYEVVPTPKKSKAKKEPQSKDKRATATPKLLERVHPWRKTPMLAPSLFLESEESAPLPSLEEAILRLRTSFARTLARIAAVDALPAQPPPQHAPAHPWQKFRLSLDLNSAAPS